MAHVLLIKKIINNIIIKNIYKTNKNIKKTLYTATANNNLTMVISITIIIISNNNK